RYPPSGTAGAKSPSSTEMWAFLTNARVASAGFVSEASIFEIFKSRGEARMSRFRLPFAVTLALLATTTPVLAQEPSGVGRIKVTSGTAYVVRQGTTIPAQSGQVVFETDSLKTGDDGRIGVTLKDDTRVSLGPSSELTLQRFVYEPGRGSFGMILQFVRGV